MQHIKDMQPNVGTNIRTELTKRKKDKIFSFIIILMM